MEKVSIIHSSIQCVHWSQATHSQTLPLEIVGSNVSGSTGHESVCCPHWGPPPAQRVCYECTWGPPPSWTLKFCSSYVFVPSYWKQRLRNSNFVSNSRTFLKPWPDSSGCKPKQASQGSSGMHAFIASSSPPSTPGISSWIGRLLPAGIGSWHNPGEITCVGLEAMKSIKVWTCCLCSLSWPIYSIHYKLQHSLCSTSHQKKKKERMPNMHVDKAKCLKYSNSRSARKKSL